MNYRKMLLTTISFCLTALCPLQTGRSEEALLTETGVSGGIAVHIGCGDGKLTAALCTSDRLLVHGLDTDADDVKKAQAHIDSLGLYGQVWAEKYDGKNLPHGDNVVNLVVAEDTSSLAAEEIERVLVPRGVVLVKSGAPSPRFQGLKKAREIEGWTEYVKPWPKDIDQWTHFLYDASGNAVSKDEKVGHPRHLQWYAGPKRSRHHDALASLSAMTSSNGRLFYIFDEGATSIIHRPAHWKLVARDAFNGKLLWKRDIPDWMTHLYNFRAGPAQLPRRLVSVGDSVFVTLGFCAATVKLDAATGNTLLTYAGSEKTEEVVYHDGVLLVVIGDPSILIEKSDGCHGYWELAEHEEPTVEKSIVAYDAASGNKLWSVTGDNLAHITPLSLSAQGDNVFYLDNKQLHCLDVKSGRQRWASEFETEGSFIRSYAPTVVAHDDVIMCLKWNRLCGYAIRTGQKLWENKGAIGFGSPGDLFAIGGKVWTPPMTKSIWRQSRRNNDGIVTTGINIPKTDFLNDAKTAVGIDIHTGEITDELPFVHNQHHHRCYRDKATVRYLLIGHSGIQLVDPTTKATATNQWVRGLCQYGIMPANGYIYVPPESCQCYSTAKINGFFALAERNSMEDIRVVPVLEKGPAYTRVLARRDTSRSLVAADASAPVTHGSKAQWPTYRGNVARSGSTACEVPGKLAIKWQATIGETITAPVIAANRVFVAQRDAYTVHCVDGKNGTRVWRFLAAGPVDSPPTIYKGLCVFGCGDGSVYCLDAATGELVWRFKTSGIERRVGSDNRLESPLPISGSVLVQENVVYFAAGRSTNLDGGIRLFGVDLWSGEKKYERKLSSGYWGQEYGRGLLPDILVSDGTTINMRQARFDKQLKPGRGPGGFVASTGLLEDTWFHRQGWSGRGSKGQLIVFGAGQSFSVGNPYTGLKQRRKGQYQKFNQVGHFHQKFTRYREDFFPLGTTISATSTGKETGAGAWSKDEKFQPRAMILAGEKLFLAGWLDDTMLIELKSGRPKNPDNPDPHESVLRVYSSLDGARISQCKLESDPVFDGVAAAYGDLFVSLKNGKLLCMGLHSTTRRLTLKAAK